MRIYYDEDRKNIVLGTTSRLFATGSLIALADRGRVAVIYRSNNFRELYIKHNQVLREDGSPAGGTISAVIDYLNGEFNKSPFTVGGGIALPAGQTITAYQVVTTNLAGDIVTADAGTVEHQGRVIGVALNSAITGASVAIADSGVVTNAGWSWTPHAVLYVGLNGTISTQQVGAFSQNLGYAISATEIFIRLGRSVVRG